MKKLIVLFLLIVFNSCALYKVKSLKSTNNINDDLEIYMPEISSSLPVLVGPDYKVIRGSNDTLYILPTQLQINRRIIGNQLDGFYIEKNGYLLISAMFKIDNTLIERVFNDLVAQNINPQTLKVYPQNFTSKNILTGLTGNYFSVDSYWESSGMDIGRLNLILQVKGSKNKETFKEQLASNTGFLIELQIPYRIKGQDKIFFNAMTCNVKNLSLSNQLIN